MVSEDDIIEGFFSTLRILGILVFLGIVSMLAWVIYLGLLLLKVI